MSTMRSTLLIAMIFALLAFTSWLAFLAAPDSYPSLQKAMLYATNGFLVGFLVTPLMAAISLRKDSDDGNA